MNESFWYVVELVGFILAGAMLVLNIILFIRLHIPLLVGELSGKRYKKEVKQIRDSYVDYDKRNRIRRQGVERREAVSPSPITPPNPIEQMSRQSWQPQTPPDPGTGANTEVMSEGWEDTVALSEQTEVLESGETTSVLQTDDQFKLVRELLLIHTDERVDELYQYPDRKGR